MNCNIVELNKDNIKSKKLNKTVLGIGIHPYDTSICLSAIVDRAMPVHGGVINVTIAPGQESYPTPLDKYFFGIVVDNGLKSQLSF